MTSPESNPAPEQTGQLPLQMTAGAVAAPDGTQLVQIRILHGRTAYVLEVPPELADQLADQGGALIRQAAAQVRRNRLGAPQLLVPGPGPLPPMRA